MVTADAPIQPVFLVSEKTAKPVLPVPHWRIVVRLPATVAQVQLGQAARTLAGRVVPVVFLPLMA